MFWPSLEHRLEREQLLGPVVDDQDVDLAVVLVIMHRVRRLRERSVDPAYHWDVLISIGAATPAATTATLRIHRLRDVIARPRINALFAVTFHRLGGQGDDRQAAELASLRMARMVS